MGCFIAPDFEDADVDVPGCRYEVLETRWIVAEGRGRIQEMASQFISHASKGDEGREESVGHPPEG